MKVFIALALLFAISLHAEQGLRPDGKLDMKSIQVNFREGELDVVKSLLESFLKQQGSSATRDEKIFAYKYLGVIYAADTAQKEKAESYFNQLLPLAPNIELADMYVSQNIQDLFDKVKREYLHTQDYSSHFDTFGNPINSGKAAPKPATKTAAQPASENHAWMWWTAAGVATAVGVGVVVWEMESPSSSVSTTKSGF